MGQRHERQRALNRNGWDLDHGTLTSWMRAAAICQTQCPFLSECSSFPAKCSPSGRSWPASGTATAAFPWTPLACAATGLPNATGHAATPSPDPGVSVPTGTVLRTDNLNAGGG